MGLAVLIQQDSKRQPPLSWNHTPRSRELPARYVGNARPILCGSDKAATIPCLFLASMTFFCFFWRAPGNGMFPSGGRPACSRSVVGGGYGSRTHDLLNAIQALYQLS